MSGQVHQETLDNNEKGREGKNVWEMRESGEEESSRRPIYLSTPHLTVFSPASTVVDLECLRLNGWKFDCSSVGWSTARMLSLASEMPVEMPSDWTGTGKGQCAARSGRGKEGKDWRNVRKNPTLDLTWEYQAGVKRRALILRGSNDKDKTTVFL